VKGRVVANDEETRFRLCEAGVGLMYAFEPNLMSRLRRGRLKLVLEDFAPSVPGFFLYFPSRAQSSPALRAFIAAAKQQSTRQRG
jgi:DNA-binding transcriptional LysR family regulator